MENDQHIKLCVQIPYFCVWQLIDKCLFMIVNPQSVLKAPFRCRIYLFQDVACYIQGKGSNWDRFPNQGLFQYVSMICPLSPLAIIVFN